MPNTLRLLRKMVKLDFEFSNLSKESLNFLETIETFSPLKNYVPLVILKSYRYRGKISEINIGISLSMVNKIYANRQCFLFHIAITIVCGIWIFTQYLFKNREL